MYGVMKIIPNRKIPDADSITVDKVPKHVYLPDC